MIDTGKSEKRLKLIKSRRATIKPIKQGGLDCLCGLYSVINAARLVVGSLSEKACCDLFKESLEVLEKRQSLTHYLTWGLNTHEISLLLNTVICPRLEIARHKFFHNKIGVSLDWYWLRIRTWLKAPNRAVILGVSTLHWSHWTVIQHASENRMICFDSDGRKVIIKSRCTFGELKGCEPLQLFTSPTFFLWK